MTGAARPDRAWLTVGATFATVAMITIITAAISYEHEYELAHRNGQPPWVSSLLPFTVDGMIFGASVVLLWAAASGIRRPWRPLGVLLVGIGATIAANLAAGIGDGWLGAAVSAWSGLALIFISDVAMWLMNARRALAAGEVRRLGVNCSCPPPPATLEEVLAVLRAERQRRGEPAGEQALAGLLGISRHRVRLALAGPAGLQAAEPSMNGDGG